MDEGGASVLSLDTTQKRERCDQKLPPLQCLEHLAESIGALGASRPFDDVPLDGGGLAPTRGG